MAKVGQAADDSEDGIGGGRAMLAGDTVSAREEGEGDVAALSGCNS